MCCGRVSCIVIWPKKKKSIDLRTTRILNSKFHPESCDCLFVCWCVPAFFFVSIPQYPHTHKHTHTLMNIRKSLPLSQKFTVLCFTLNSFLAFLFLCDLFSSFSFPFPFWKSQCGMKLYILKTKNQTNFTHCVLYSSNSKHLLWNSRFYVLKCIKPYYVSPHSNPQLYVF